MWRDRLRGIGDGVARACLALAGIALLVIVAINGANVVGRYLFGAAIVWAEESMQYLMILIVFLGAAVISWRGLHLRLEAVIDRMPQGVRTLAVYVTTFAGIGLLAAIASASFEIVSMLYAFDQRSDAMELPMFIPQSFVLGGFALSAVMMLLRLAVFGAAMPSSVTENVSEEIR